MKNVIGYTRVSTAEQGRSGLGLDAQRAAIEAAASRRGWTVTWAHDANGERAGNLMRYSRRHGFRFSTEKRPSLTRALDLLRAGKADGIVVAKWDRLVRSTLDLGLLIPMFQAHRWALVALDLDVDTSTPMGRANANMVVTFAELERDRIRERTRDALAQARARGVKLGRPGIKSTPATVRARILRLRKQGTGYAMIARRLNAERVPTAQGGRCWYAATVRKVALAA